MQNRGAVSGSIGINGSYTIPEGYHNGNGKVTQSIPVLGEQTITPGTAAKAVPAGYYLSGRQTIAGDANLVPDNIAEGKSIFGVTGNLKSSNIVHGNLEGENSMGGIRPKADQVIYVNPDISYFIIYLNSNTTKYFFVTKFYGSLSSNASCLNFDDNVYHYSLTTNPVSNYIRIGAMAQVTNHNFYDSNNAFKYIAIYL